MKDWGKKVIYMGAENSKFGTAERLIAGNGFTLALMNDTTFTEGEGDTAIRLILENDIRPKINILAENHLDLNSQQCQYKKCG